MIDFRAALMSLTEAGIEFVVVGGVAAVMRNTPVVTFDLDIVHRRTDENVDRILQWCHQHGAHHRFDLANRKLPPARESLLGSGHVNLMTDIGELDLLCELTAGTGFDEILLDTDDFDGIRVLTLRRLIDVKSRANRPKDRAVMHLLLAALDDEAKNGC